MKEDWEKCIAFVLKMEGGETVENDPNDPGGETKFGISKKSYPQLNIAALTLEEAKEIYKRDYWIPCRCDELPYHFALAVFDAAGNQGVGRSKRMLQAALGVTVDGIIGNKTLQAAVEADPRKVKKLLAIRLAEYAKLMAANQNLLVFAVNWSFRVICLAELIFSKND